MQIKHWGYTPGWNHLLRALDDFCSCWHLGYAGSECVWMSWMWLMIEVHLANFSGTESELVADQYRWLVMLLCHFFTKLQSFSLEIFSTFFDNPNEVTFTGKTYHRLKKVDAVSFLRSMDRYFQPWISEMDFVKQDASITFHHVPDVIIVDDFTIL